MSNDQGHRVWDRIALTTLSLAALSIASCATDGNVQTAQVGHEQAMLQEDAQARSRQVLDFKILQVPVSICACTPSQVARGDRTHFKLELDTHDPRWPSHTGETVDLAYSDPSALINPPSVVVVPSRASYVKFDLFTNPTTDAAYVKITATTRGSSQSVPTTLTISR